MTDWPLRRARIEDARALGDCLEAAYAPYRGRIEGLPSMTDGLVEEIADKQVWLAEKDGIVVGALVLAPERDFLLLANVAVRPSARGDGLGRQLLRFAEAEAAAQGHPELRLTTSDALPEILALYARNGWQEAGREGGKVRMRKRI